MCGFPECWSGTASAFSRAGRAGQALQLLGEATPLARAQRNEELLARILNVEGDVYYYQGNYARARGQYQQAHAIAARGRVSRPAELTTRLNLAMVDVKDGQLKLTAQTLSRVGAAAARAGLKFESTQAMILVAEIALKQKQYTRARSALDAALTQADRLGAKSLLAQAQYLMSVTDAAVGDQVQARRHRDSARQLLEVIRKDSPSDDVLRRSDLKPILESPSS